MHRSQIQGCIVEQRVEKKRKIAESVWVHIVQWLGVELCKLSLQASKIHFCIHKMYGLP